MARYVIDPATLLHIVSGAVAIDADHQLVAPNGIRSQALTMLLDAVNAGALTDAEALELHERLTELKIRVLGDRVSRRTAWKIAREQGWNSIAEAEYLAVCRLQADALVTVDVDFAARAEGIVALAPLAALSRA